MYKGTNMLEAQLIKIMQTYVGLDRDLALVQQLKLPNWCIAAGYVRNYVWDYLHEYTTPTPLNDIDVLYYDPSDLSDETEKMYSNLLRNKLSKYNWSCKNQARMHIRNHDHPYESVGEAMKRWPETATAVSISLDLDNNIEIVAPLGLNDLFELTLRKSPYFKDKDLYYTRIYNKKWMEIWPLLKLVESV